MNIKIGDVVILKSGSPLMTVSEIGKYNYDDFEKAKCIWFEKTKRFEDLFPLETLKIYEDKSNL